MKKIFIDTLFLFGGAVTLLANATGSFNITDSTSPAEEASLNIDTKILGGAGANSYIKATEEDLAGTNDDRTTTFFGGNFDQHQFVWEVGGDSQNPTDIMSLDYTGILRLRASANNTDEFLFNPEASTISLIDDTNTVTLSNDNGIFKVNGESILTQNNLGNITLLDNSIIEQDLIIGTPTDDGDPDLTLQGSLSLQHTTNSTVYSSFWMGDATLGRDDGNIISSDFINFDKRIKVGTVGIGMPPGKDTGGYWAYAGIFHTGKALDIYNYNDQTNQFESRMRITGRHYDPHVPGYTTPGISMFDIDSFSIRDHSSTSNHSFYVKTGATAKVGINTGNPEEELHVNGDAKIEGDLVVVGAVALDAPLGDISMGQFID